VYDDILYYGETEKQRKRRKLAEARRKGKAGEEIYKLAPAPIDLPQLLQ